MKEKLFTALGACALIALGMAATAYGQLLPGETVRASIPFDFIVSGKMLAAGDYEISRITESPYALLIRNVNDNHDEAVFLVNHVEARLIPRSGEIVFDRYGDSYFLSKIWERGEQTGDEILPSRQERQLEREFAGHNHAPETVALAWY
jgi:hypothetical protein